MKLTITKPIINNVNISFISFNKIYVIDCTDEFMAKVPHEFNIRDMINFVLDL